MNLVVTILLGIFILGAVSISAPLGEMCCFDKELELLDVAARYPRPERLFTDDISSFLQARTEEGHSIVEASGWDAEGGEAVFLPSWQISQSRPQTTRQEKTSVDKVLLPSRRKAKARLNARTKARISVQGCSCDWADSNPGVCEGRGDGSHCFRICCGSPFKKAKRSLRQKGSELKSNKTSSLSVVGQDFRHQTQDNSSSSTELVTKDVSCDCKWAAESDACGQSDDNSPCHKVCCSAEHKETSSAEKLTQQMTEKMLQANGLVSSSRSTHSTAKECGCSWASQKACEGEGDGTYCRNFCCLALGSVAGLDTKILANASKTKANESSHSKIETLASVSSNLTVKDPWCFDLINRKPCTNINDGHKKMLISYVGTHSADEKIELTAKSTNVNEKARVRAKDEGEEIPDAEDEDELPMPDDLSEEEELVPDP